MDRPLYCFAHNIAFDSGDLYADHMRDCNNLREVACMCTQHANDGSMCGEIFDTLDDLRDHCLAVHFVHICTICDAQSTRPLVGHSHKAKDVSVRSCKQKTQDTTKQQNVS